MIDQPPHCARNLGTTRGANQGRISTPTRENHSDGAVRCARLDSAARSADTAGSEPGAPASSWDSGPRAVRIRCQRSGRMEVIPKKSGKRACRPGSGVTSGVVPQRAATRRATHKLPTSCRHELPTELRSLFGLLSHAFWSADTEQAEPVLQRARCELAEGESVAADRLFGVEDVAGFVEVGEVAGEVVEVAAQLVRFQSLAHVGESRAVEIGR